jgi:hypothetical protein
MEEKLSAWEQYKKNLGSTRPWDIVNPNTNWVDEKISKQRFDICKSCPELIALTSQCKKCGCFMNLKTKLEKAVCPIGKW